MTMKKSLLTIGSILPLICVRQAKGKLAPTKDAVQGSGLGQSLCIDNGVWEILR
jgi:hypothetical protein